MLFAVTLPPVLDANAEGDRLTAQASDCQRSLTMRCPVGESERLSNQATQAYNQRDSGLPGVIAGAVMIGTGAAALIASAFMATGADPVDRFQRPPTFRVAAGPGGAGISMAW